MNNHLRSPHTTLFRVASTIVLGLLLLTVVNTSYADSDNVLLKFLNQVSSIFFNTSSSPASTSSVSQTAVSPKDSVTTCIRGIDPTPDPPPPPPPPDPR